MDRKNVLSFVLGATIGALISYMYMSKKHEEFLIDEAEWCDDLSEEVIEKSVEEENKVLVMNKDRYKKITTNYSNTMDLNELVSNTPRRPAPNPYVIDFEVFCEDSENEKLTVTYYQSDDTLVDENEDMISDISGVIGYEALNNFGKGSDDPDIVYVRNEKLGIDYEVVRVEGGYKEVILGESE